MVPTPLNTPRFPGAEKLPADVRERLTSKAVAIVKARAADYHEGPIAESHPEFKAQVAAADVDVTFKQLAEEYEHEKNFWPGTGVRRSGREPEPEEYNDLRVVAVTPDKRTEKMQIVKQREGEPVTMADVLTMHGFEYVGTIEKTKVFKQAGTEIEAALEGDTFVLGSDADGVLAGGRGTESLTMALTADTEEE